jgi:hypothetical protein
LRSPSRANSKTRENACKGQQKLKPPGHSFSLALTATFSSSSESEKGAPLSPALLSKQFAGLFAGSNLDGPTSLKMALGAYPVPALVGFVFVALDSRIA